MENFIVSARKYRPATFASVVGQRHITETLRNAISRGQLAHAYLFCGPRGVGKTTCARIFAKAINCTDPQTTTGPDGAAGFEACGRCESCRGFDEGRSFNIHELDAASNNSVEDIRNLTDQVRIPPQVGRYSVYIIDEVHMLSAAAFNAFLKTLEEPPAHAVFILATTEKHKIIPTILSRCQTFDFNRIRVADAVGYMKYIAHTEGVTCDEESLNLIARKADGGMRDALSMFDKAVSFCGAELRYKEVATSLNILDYDTYFDTVDTVLVRRGAGALRPGAGAGFLGPDLYGGAGEPSARPACGSQSGYGGAFRCHGAADGALWRPGGALRGGVSVRRHRAAGRSRLAHPHRHQSAAAGRVGAHEAVHARRTRLGRGR